MRYKWIFLNLTIIVLLFLTFLPATRSRLVARSIGSKPSTNRYSADRPTYLPLVQKGNVAQPTPTVSPTPTPPPTTTISSPFTVIGGDKGTILHWTNSQWISSSSPLTRPMKAARAFSSQLAWIGGGDISGNRFLLRWDGVSWTLWSGLPGDTIYALNKISFSSQQDGWATYTSFKNLSYLIHWDGNTWSQVKNDSLRYTGISAIAPNDVWIAASSQKNTILHWDASSWKTVLPPFDLDYVYDIAFHQANYGWAVGEKGLAMRWNGSTWVKETTPLQSSAFLYAVCSLSPTDAWAVGSSGNIIHWNGSTWSSIPSPAANDLYAVDCSSSSNAWAVGLKGTILHWDGQTWVKVASPTSNNLYTVSIAK